MPENSLDEYVGGHTSPEEIDEYDSFVEEITAKTRQGNINAIALMENWSGKRPEFGSVGEYNRFIDALPRHFSLAEMDVEFWMDKYLREIGKGKVTREKLSQTVEENKSLRVQVRMLKKQLDEFTKEGVTGLGAEGVIIGPEHIRARHSRNENGREEVRAEKRQRAVYSVGGKIPPQAIDIEDLLIGHFLIKGKIPEEFSKGYIYKMMYKDDHQILYKAMLEVTGPISEKKIVNKLRIKGELEYVGGPYYVTQIVEEAKKDLEGKTQEDIDLLIMEYVEVLENKFLKREVIRISSEIMSQAYEDEETDSVPEWMRAMAMQFIDAMPRRFKIHYDFKSLISTTVETFKKHVEREGLPEISTGYRSLDRITHGIVPGRLVFLGMRSKNGKTTVSANIADKVAQQNKYAMIFTYESRDQSVVNKLIAKRALVDLEKLSYYDKKDKENEPLTKDEITRYLAAAREVSKLKLIIRGRPADPDYVVREVKLQKSLHPELAFVVIDGIQAFGINVPKGTNKSDYLYNVLTKFHSEIAEELNVMVWVNGQLDKLVEKRKNKRPSDAGDYSDCKGVAEIADVALLGYMPGHYFEPPEFQGFVSIWPTDVREGKKHGRACYLGIMPEHGNLYELSEKQFQTIELAMKNNEVKIQKRVAETEK